MNATSRLTSRPQTSVWSTWTWHSSVNTRSGFSLPAPSVTSALPVSVVPCSGKMTIRQLFRWLIRSTLSIMLSHELHSSSGKRRRPEANGRWADSFKDMSTSLWSHSVRAETDWFFVVSSAVLLLSCSAVFVFVSQVDRHIHVPAGALSDAFHTMHPTSSPSSRFASPKLHDTTP